MRLKWAKLFKKESNVLAIIRAHVLSRFLPKNHHMQIILDAFEEFGGSSDEGVSWTVAFGLANSENHTGADPSAIEP